MLSPVVGIMGIIAGICCFVTPADSFIVPTDYFVVLMIVGGIFKNVTAASNAKWNRYWGWDLVRVILELLLGIWIIMLPELWS